MKGSRIGSVMRGIVGAALVTAVVGCSSNPYPLLPKSAPKIPFTTNPDEYRYLVGPGDTLNIFVWRNQEVSDSVIVRPDGMVSTPLVEDIPVSGLTPSQVARRIEEKLSVYIREPIVTVQVSGFQGPFSEQVRIIGEAAKPQALPYQEDMTLLDVMIAVGGVTEFAAGNKASVVRIVDGEQRQFGVRIDDLTDGDISANADILPGDIIIVPEAWF